MRKEFLKMAFYEIIIMVKKYTERMVIIVCIINIAGDLLYSSKVQAYVALNSNKFH